MVYNMAVKKAGVRKYLLLIFAFFCIELVLITFNSSNKSSETASALNNAPAFLHQTNASAQAVAVPSLKPKKILIWNRYWKSSTLWSKVFYEIIHHQCPISNCQLTNNRSEADTADAVLFHLVNLPAEKYKMPERKSLKQLWIITSFEPPYIVSTKNVNLKRLNGVFNRTMTYRLDSDVITPHGKYNLITSSMEWPTYLSNWFRSRDTIATRNYAAGKRRLVAWFATSRGCKSGSGREKYIQQLQKHVKVDIYGACGPFKCGNQKTLSNPYSVEYDDCYMLVSLSYKFYLAFENSICEDYVTEKLYNNLKLNVIPIVFGGADYVKFAPPHSVIDATRFTPKELADYLTLLDSNDTLFNEYFAWKSKYYIEAHDGVLMMCDLCAKLNDNNWVQEVKVYDEFDKWFGSKCYPGYAEEDEHVPYAKKYWNVSV